MYGNVGLGVPQGLLRNMGLQTLVWITCAWGCHPQWVKWSITAKSSSSY